MQSEGRFEGQIWVILKSERARVNISGIKAQEGLEYFRRLEKQNEWLDNQHIDACISIMCKWAHEHYPQLYKQKICILDTYFYPWNEASLEQ